MLGHSTTFGTTIKMLMFSGILSVTSIPHHFHVTESMHLQGHKAARSDCFHIFCFSHVHVISCHSTAMFCEAAVDLNIIISLSVFKRCSDQVSNVNHLKLLGWGGIGFAGYQLLITVVVFPLLLETYKTAQKAGKGNS